MKGKIIIVSKTFLPANSMAAKRFGYMGKYIKEYGFDPYYIAEKKDSNLHVSGPCGNIGALEDNAIESHRIKWVGNAKDEKCIQNPVVSQFFRIMQLLKYELRTITEDDYSWYERCKQAYECGQFNDLRDASLIVCTFPGIGSVYTARYLSKKMNIPYIVDIRDLISQYEDVEPGWKKSKIIDFMIEKWLVSPSAGITTTTEGFQDILSKIYHKPCVTIFNGWNEDYRCKNAEDSKEKYMYYAGCLYEHRMKSVFALIDITKNLNEQGFSIKLILRISGPVNLYRRLNQYINSHQLGSYIILKESTNEKNVHQEQMGAFINVVFSETDSNKKYLMTTVPGKVYELLTFPAPVLTIASPQTEINHILSVTNKGIVTLDSKEAENFIINNMSNYSGNEKINYFSRKSQAWKISRFFEKIIERTKR